MGLYRATVQKMIQNRWAIPRGIAVKRHPEVVVRINRAGKVTYSRNHRSSGNQELDRSAINAVRIGSTLIPLPEGYRGDSYEITVKFQVD
jgi:TonB family protein